MTEHTEISAEATPSFAAKTGIFVQAQKRLSLLIQNRARPVSPGLVRVSVNWGRRAPLGSSTGSWPRCGPALCRQRRARRHHRAEARDLLHQIFQRSHLLNHPDLIQKILQSDWPDIRRMASCSACF